MPHGKVPRIAMPTTQRQVATEYLPRDADEAEEEEEEEEDEDFTPRDQWGALARQDAGKIVKYPPKLDMQWGPRDGDETDDDVTPRNQWGTLMHTKKDEIQIGKSSAKFDLQCLPRDGDETDDDMTPRDQWGTLTQTEKNDGVPDKGAIIPGSIPAGFPGSFVETNQGIVPGSIPGNIRLPKAGKKSEPVVITTIAIRNLLYSLRLQDLLAAIDESGYADLYDVVYLPRKGKGDKNLGFAFVNFVTPEAAAHFCTEWHRTRRQKLGTRHHPLNLSAATVQGRRANEKVANSNKMSHLRTTFLRPK